MGRGDRGLAYEGLVFALWEQVAAPIWQARDQLVLGRSEYALLILDEVGHRFDSWKELAQEVLGYPPQWRRRGWQGRRRDHRELIALLEGAGVHVDAEPKPQQLSLLSAG